MQDADKCKHGRIQRNCYICHLEFVYPQNPKAEMDTLHETISELKVRVSKLEEYKRLADDEIKKLSDFQSVINHRWSTCVIHKNKQIDENRAVSKHLTDLDESYQGLSAEVRHLLEISKKNGNPLLWTPFVPSWVSTEKTKDLTFAEAFDVFMTGKTIHRKYGCRFTLMDASGITFSPNDILANDWVIAE